MKKKFLILTPEGSTNWLFDPHFVMNIFQYGLKIIIDEEDIKRYKRFAKFSDLDFVKLYCLSLLKTSGYLEIVNYRGIYREPNLRESMDFLKQKGTFYKNTEIYHSDLEFSQKEYRKYISNKKIILDSLKNQSDRSTWDRELNESTNDQSKIGLYKNREAEINYIRRLCTKILAAYHVALSYDGLVLDSLVYKTGIKALKDSGKDLSRFFDEGLFEENESWSRLLEKLDSENVLGKNSSPIPFPITFLSTLKNIKGDQNDSLVQTVIQDLQKAELDSLRSEVYSFVIDTEIRKSDLKKSFSYLLSLTGTIANLPLLSFGSIGIDALSLNKGWKFVPGYSITSQIIGNAIHTDKRSNLRLKIFNWTSYFYSIFNRSINCNDQIYIATQRGTTSWASNLRWYEE